MAFGGLGLLPGV